MSLKRNLVTHAHSDNLAHVRCLVHEMVCLSHSCKIIQDARYKNFISVSQTDHRIQSQIYIYTMIFKNKDKTKSTGK